MGDRQCVVRCSMGGPILPFGGGRFNEPVVGPFTATPAAEGTFPRRSHERAHGERPQM